MFVVEAQISDTVCMWTGLVNYLGQPTQFIAGMSCTFAGRCWRVSSFNPKRTGGVESTPLDV